MGQLQLYSPFMLSFPGKWLTWDDNREAFIKQLQSWIATSTLSSDPLSIRIPSTPLMSVYWKPKKLIQFRLSIDEQPIMHCFHGLKLNCLCNASKIICRKTHESKKLYYSQFKKKSYTQAWKIACLYRWKHALYNIRACLHWNDLLCIGNSKWCFNYNIWLAFQHSVKSAASWLVDTGK